MEYREQPRAKTGVAVPLGHLVALLGGASPEAAVVDFIRVEIAAGQKHPRQKDLIAGATEFAASSAELQRWREELRGAMRASLDSFRAESVDPARLEAALDQGLAAMRVYRLVAPRSEQEEALQQELTSTHRNLVERFAIAGVLQKTGLYDQYLEKMDQIGLARWSRPPLADGRAGDEGQCGIALQACHGTIQRETV